MSVARRNLDRSLVHGVAWTAGMKWATQIISWGSTLVVVRLLNPSDYGVYGMATVFMGLVAPIYDLGVSSAIVQKRDLDRDQVARLGGLSLLYAAAFSLACILAAPLIARYYHEPDVMKLVIMISAAYFITAPQMLPRAILTRDLNFRALAWIEGVSAVTLTAANLVFALMGYRYWALAYGFITSSVITTAVAMAWAPHAVAWPRRLSSIAREARFGFNVAGSRVGTYAYSNADFFIIGRVLGKAALGAYQFGWTLATIPVDRVSSLVSRVLPSIMAAVQDDVAQLRRYTLGLTEAIAFIAMPLALGVAVTADDFVRVALGDRWAAAVAPLRFLAFYGALRSITTVFSPLLVAVGRARQDRQYTLIALCLLPPLFYVGTRWGVMGVAAAWTIGFPISLVPRFRATLRVLQLRLVDYIAVVTPPIASSAAMAASVLAVRAMLPASVGPHMRLPITTLVGAVVYFAIIRLRYWDRITAFLALIKRARGREEPPAEVESSPPVGGTPEIASA